MAHPILMPKPGQMTEECTLILWRKAEGDPVHKGDVLFEIETDKSAMEVEAWDEGILLRQVVAAGSVVPVNAICAWVGEPGETIPDTIPSPAVADSVPADAVPASAPASAPVAPAVALGVAPSAAALDARTRISPRASRLAATAGIDPHTVTGTGPEGRITERDVQASLASASTATLIDQAGPGPATPRPPTSGTASSRAADQGFGVEVGEGVAEPMSRMRRVISDRLVQSWTTTPHFTVTVAVNVHRLLAFRAELKASGTPLSVTDFVLAAVSQTLVEFPDVNSRVDGTSIVRERRIHLGLAVSVAGGLLVPVIRDADLLTVTGIHERSQDLIAAARAGTVRPDDLSGSTFTVSNLGMFEVEEFSAIINPGEGAILAVASAVPTPIAVGDGIAVRPIMKVTLSADHRVVDGETAARFLGALRRRLEDVEALRSQVLMD